MINFFLPFVAFIATLWATEYKFTRVYLGPGQNAVCEDTDHDGLSEIIVTTYYEDIEDPALEIYENQNGNNYKLVYSDTGTFFKPLDVGDVDGDGLTDLLGWENPNIYAEARIRESPDSFSYPSTVNWECWYDTSSAYHSQSFYFADLDQDGKKEIVIIRNDNVTISIFENMGDNQNELVCSDTVDDYISTIGFGDFDEDGKMEFATAGAQGYVFVDENTGDNTYERVFEDSIPRYNGHDVFTGNDTDQDGLPEFFINYGTYTTPWSTLCFYLYRYEATGDNTYAYLLIDSITDRSGDFHIRSSCGDVDGDGVEEIVWSIGSAVAVLKATGNDQYERVWQWENDHKHGAASAEIRCYDLNHDGKDEIVVSGNEHTSIFEYDTTTTIQEREPSPIRVLSLAPNPFRKTITLSYSLSHAGPVELKVYDMSGRCIKTLLTGRNQEPGVYSVTWDGKADNGQKVASAIYFYRLETKTNQATKKLIRIK